MRVIRQKTRLPFSRTSHRQHENRPCAKFIYGGGGGGGGGGERGHGLLRTFTRVPQAVSNCSWERLLAQMRLAWIRKAPDRLARFRLAPFRLARFKLARFRLAPDRLALPKLASFR